MTTNCESGQVRKKAAAAVMLGVMSRFPSPFLINQITVNMSYLALARKWRPKSFADVVGQKHVVKALANSLESGKVHHAFLFTGTRGVGKTTIARIFAKALNCEQGVSAEPCLTCDTCVSIDEGRYVDLIEVDAASRTKVDDTRELLDNVQYAPSFGKYKVFLIDEVHMLSGHSFNALLKTLEEPPEHVKFLFATTDPQKLPITVLSRCLQFNLRAMQEAQIEKQLHKVAQAEQIEAQVNAIKLLSKAANGSMRDALSLLDQAIALSGNTLSTEIIQSMLGSIRVNHSSALMRGLADNNIDQILCAINEMAELAVDFYSAIDDVLQHLYYVSLYQLHPDALQYSDVDLGLLEELSVRIPPSTVQLYYQTGLIAKRDLALAPNLRVGFEMAFLRMLAFELTGENNLHEVSAEPVEPKQPDSVKQTTPNHTFSSKHEKNTNVQAVIENDVELNSNKQQQLGNSDEVVSEPEPHIVTTERHSLESAITVSDKPVKTQSNDLANGGADVHALLASQNPWFQLIEKMGLDGLTRELAMNSVCLDINQTTLVLYLSSELAFLDHDNRRLELEEGLSNVLNQATRVTIHIEDVTQETPAQYIERLGVEKQDQLTEKFEQDKAVQHFATELEMNIDTSTIRPVGE